MGQEPLESIPSKNIAKMMKAYERGTFTGDRGIAVVLSLLDTGARVNEFVLTSLDDLNQARGDIHICKGKGRKHCFVFLERLRENPSDAI